MLHSCLLSLPGIRQTHLEAHRIPTWGNISHVEKKGGGGVTVLLKKLTFWKVFFFLNLTDYGASITVKAQRKSGLWLETLSNHSTVQLLHFMGSEVKEGRGYRWVVRPGSCTSVSKNRNWNSACFVFKLKKKNGGQLCPNVLIDCPRHKSMNDKPC